MKIVYSDQNNNVYVVTSDALSYDPITESESSSGVYSGGEPFKVALDESEYEEIMKLAQQIANDPKENRISGKCLLRYSLWLITASKALLF